MRQLYRPESDKKISFMRSNRRRTELLMWHNVIRGVEMAVKWLLLTRLNFLVNEAS